MLKSAKVPPAFVPLFEKAESQVEQQFQRVRREPEKGVLHVGEDRYVMVRAEGFYVGWLDSMVVTFGSEVARQFIYNSEREIGRNDSKSFAQRLSLGDPTEKLAAGPVHFAHAGWAFVDILDDSAPAPNDQFFLHDYHPNTFESEVLASLHRKSEDCACLFSAGYSSGWCSAAFILEVHGREIACVARGDRPCEFIMAPAHLLDEHERRLNTVFPWPVSSTQCKRIGVDPANLTLIDLERIARLLAQGVARFTTPAHEAAIKAKLAALVASTRGQP